MYSMLFQSSIFERMLKCTFFHKRRVYKKSKKERNLRTIVNLKKIMRVFNSFLNHSKYSMQMYETK